MLAPVIVRSLRVLRQRLLHRHVGRPVGIRMGHDADLLTLGHVAFSTDRGQQVDDE